MHGAGKAERPQEVPPSVSRNTALYHLFISILVVSRWGRHQKLGPSRPDHDGLEGEFFSWVPSQRWPGTRLAAMKLVHMGVARAVLVGESRSSEDFDDALLAVDTVRYPRQQRREAHINTHCHATRESERHLMG